MSAVHDWATVNVSMLVDPDDDASLRLERGDRIEVVGYAYQGHHIMAIWRDDAGALHDILAGAIRMETQDDRNVARLHRYLGVPSAKPVNAIAGPQTAMQRGVR